MTWVKKWKVEGSKGNIYTVSLSNEGEYGCSCPVWSFRRSECKHIKLVRSGGGSLIVEGTATDSEVAASSQPREEKLTGLASLKLNARWGE